MNISGFIPLLADKIWSFPFLLTLLGVCVLMTVRLGFVQIRHFIDAFRFVFSANKPTSSTTVEVGGDNLTPIQAFMNTLGANIGNGSLAGIPTAIAAGGPGAIFWMLLMSTFAVSLRYAEVYLGMHFIGKKRFLSAKGGPMLYLSLLPAGSIFSYIFAVFCLFYAFICGNVVQCHAVGLAVHRTWGISTQTTAFVILACILYILFGGAQRIAKVLDKLVPFKVIIFLLSAVVVLLYHIQAVPAALYLIFASAFSTKAAAGGVVGFTIQRAMATGFQRGMFAHEAGLGTAAVAYGSTKGTQPVKDAIISMLSVFINTHVICLLVAVLVIASGVWTNGETSAALIISAYETVFGKLAGWIITFLTINFGMSVVISYAYIGKVCWSFLTNKWLVFVFSILYGFWAYYGTIMHVGLVWSASDLINAGLFVTNVIGLIWFLPIIKKELVAFQNR